MCTRSITLDGRTADNDDRLSAFQDAFARALFTDPSAGAGDGIGNPCSGSAGERCAAVRSVEALIAQPGFAVYRNTVMKGCIDALQANYPAVCRLVGEEWFRAAAALFVRRRPPTMPVLLMYGEAFPDFLAGFEPAREFPYLPGVARLDRFWAEAHAAPEEVPVAAANVAALAPHHLARSILWPHASARWAWFADSPVATIWHRNRLPPVQPACAPGHPRRNDDSSAARDVREPLDDGELAWRAEGILIARPRAAVERLALDAAGIAFLDACRARRTLGDAAAAALAVDADADLSSLMARLLAAGAFGRLAIVDPFPAEVR